jgi:carboxylesterase type B
MMVDYWTAFARAGDPNSEGKDAPPHWAPYSTDKDNVQVLDLPKPKSALGYGSAYDCAMWEQVLSFK